MDTKTSLGHFVEEKILWPLTRFFFDVCLYILCLIENYTEGVMSNYIPEMCEVTIRSFIVLWHVQDTKVVCHKKSPFHCLVQFVFICLHECNEVT